jgi:hypothetical protein
MVQHLVLLHKSVYATMEAPVVAVEFLYSDDRWKVYDYLLF